MRKEISYGTRVKFNSKITLLEEANKKYDTLCWYRDNKFIEAVQAGRKSYIKNKEYDESGSEPAMIDLFLRGVEILQNRAKKPTIEDLKEYLNNIISKGETAYERYGLLQKEIMSSNVDIPFPRLHERYDNPKEAYDYIYNLKQELYKKALEEKNHS